MSKIIAKATPTTQVATQLEKLVKNVDASVAQLTQAQVAVGQLTQIVADATEQVAIKQHQLNALDEELQVNVRKHEAELRLQKLENKNKLLDELLREEDLVRLTNGEHITLLKRIQVAERDVTAEIEDRVAKGLEKLKVEHTAELNRINADRDIAKAKDDAKIESLQAQLDLVTAQLEAAKNSADAERTARIEIEKARGASLAQLNRTQG